MTLRNAFEGLSTEAKQDLVLDALASIIDQGTLSRSLKGVFGDQYQGGRDRVVSMRFDTQIPQNKALTSGNVSQTGAKAVIGGGGTAGHLWSRDLVTYDSGFDLWSSFTAGFVGTGDSHIGLFTGDRLSGVWLGTRAGVVSLGRSVGASSPGAVDGDVDVLPRASWDDPLDGSGPSGEDLDLSTSHVWRLRTGLHGNGPVILEVLRRTWIPVHVLAGDGIPDAALPTFDLRAYLYADAATVLSSSSCAAGSVQPWQKSRISFANSTDVPLGPGEEFVGEWIDLLDHETVQVSIASDVASASMGIIIEHSPDGIRPTPRVPRFTFVPEEDPDGNVRARSFPVDTEMRFGRVRYINGPVAQTWVSIQTILRPDNGLGPIHRIGDLLTSDDAANVVKAVNASEQPDGDWANQKASGAVQEVSILDGSVLLAPGETWTSPIFDSDGWEHIEVLVRASHASADNGLVFRYFHESLDATTNVFKDEFTYIPDGDPDQSTPFRLGTMQDGFRIEYTNGSIQQVAFLISVVLHPHPASPKLIPLGTDVGTLAQALLTQVVRSMPEPADNWKVTRDSVGTAVQPLLPTNLTRRRAFLIQVPDGNRLLRLGTSPGFTTQYFTVFPGVPGPGIELGPGKTIYGRSDSGTVTYEIIEVT